MTNKRAYGDAMIADCVAQLCDAGVPIQETKSSGSVRGDGDAKMSRGGFMLEGKASYSSTSLTASYTDFTKALKQARNHCQIAILVVENKHKERWAFMRPDDSDRLGIEIPPALILLQKSRGKSWWLPSKISRDLPEENFPDDTVAVCTHNCEDTLLVAIEWSTFVELISKVWKDDTTNTGDTGGKENKNFKSQGKSLGNKGRKFRNRGFR